MKTERQRGFSLDSNEQISQIHGRFQRFERQDRWTSKVFFFVQAKFRFDNPHDMSMSIVTALRETILSGHRRPLGGLILVSDSLDGSVMIEVEPAYSHDERLKQLSGFVASRALPKGASLRDETEDFFAWVYEQGQSLSTMFVSYQPGSGPRDFLPSRLIGFSPSRTSDVAPKSQPHAVSVPALRRLAG